MEANTTPHSGVVIARSNDFQARRSKPTRENLQARGQRVTLHAPLLAYFDAVARLGSIRCASDHLNVASSAINRQILRLEREVGVQLFDRLPRGMRLTAAGEILVSHVRSTLKGFDIARSQIEDLTALHRGHVSIAAVEGVIAGTLPDTLFEFGCRYPNITVSIKVMSAEQVLATLGAKDADIGLAFNLPSSAEVRQVASVKLPIGAVMAPDHPLRGRKSLYLRDCVSHPVILPDASHPNRAWLDMAASRASVRLKPIATTDSFQLMRMLARRGQGIAFQTVIGIERDLLNGDLIYVPLKDPGLDGSTMSLLVPTKIGVSSAASVLLEQLTSALTQLGRSHEDALLIA